MGRSYTIDFNALQQINEDTGTTRPIQRCAGAGESTSLTLQSGSNTEQDDRIEILQDGPDGNAFTHVLFACLYNIMNSSVGVAVRHKCINAMLRLACYAPSDLLSEILKRHPISSLIGEMLQSNDLRTLVNALQIADILMKKLPDIYHISFRREGVMHKANALASGSFMATTPQSKQTKSKAQDGGRGLSLAGEPYSSHQAHLIQVFEKPPSPPTSRRLGDVFRGKRRSKRTPRSKEKCQSLMEQDLSYITPQPSDDGPDLEKRLRVFVQSFMDQSNVDNKPALASLITKLHCCVNQVEQFPVKVHDAPSGTSSSSGSRGSQALRFFSTHQIKCHLQRHPDCKTVRQWKGGPVKIDPLALVQTSPGDHAWRQSASIQHDGLPSS
ncbi:predicted protein [Nematostella vectensis]|uniref:E3 ubiquitin-protein ligase n=1 Tax=Nematostella vectensis TaxID=45351 RepID=A7T9F6_NEMVE|nr:predicted protein [Nematostella vectensis]|eukprot:XP_001619470.1 hypothetical protein NEMVEDRAFT_v1g224152 [Nematostella vectensis]